MNMLNLNDLSRVDLNLLVLFRVVLDERHVGRAAARLNLVPTARAMELSQPVAEILARVESVMASAAPFDPATSNRRFVIGAPDAVLASGMISLLPRIETNAPHVDIG